MKKLLLAFVGVALASTTVFSQDFAGDNTGVGIDFTTGGAGYCTYNSSTAPALFFPGHNIKAAGVSQASSPAALQLTSEANMPLADDGGAVWGLVKVNPSNICDYMWTQAPTGLDMTAAANQTAKLYIRADGNTNIAFMIGTSSGAFPTAATSAPIAITSSWQQITVDFSSADPAILGNVNAWGFKTDMYNGNIYVRWIGLGSKNTVPAGTLLATSNEKVSFALSAFPNPSNDVVNLDLSALNGAEATVKVMNSLGAVVKVETATSTNHAISVSNLEKGVYMIQVSSGNRVSNKKIVVE